MALITLDFETYYDKEFSLRRMTYENYVRDPRFEVIMCSIHIPSEKELYYVRGDEVGKELQRLELGKHLQVAHNNAFDAFILADHYGISAQGYGCTMNMARVVKNGNGSVSLDNLSKENNLKPKGDYVDNMTGIRASDMRESQWDAYGNYCLRDSENCTALYNIYRPYFSAQDMNLISETIRWGAECKFELNEQLLDEYRQELELKRETRLERVAQRYNTDTTKLRSMLRSPKAFAQMLRDLGIEPPTKVNDKGKTTFAFAKDDLNFQELGEHEDERVVELYETKVGTSSSIAETRAATFHAISKRGYMPFPLVPFKAHTGRHGATQKLNTQNLPKRGGDTKLRQSMCAPKDHVVLTCDLSQVEARRIAALAGQSNLIEQFAAGQDVYSIFGTDFYGRTISKATPTERNVSKECVLSLGFSAGANSFRDRMQAAYGINMTLDEAKALVKFYRNRHPQIVKFWEQCANAIKVMHKGGEYKFGQDGELTAVKGEIVLADGWRLRYDDITHDGYDEYGRDMFSYHSHMHRCRKHLYSGLAANNVTQGSAARIFHWQLFQMRRKNRIMSGAVHDEYNAVVHIKDMFDYYDDMTTIMRTSPSWAANTPLDCEFEMGHNYGKLSSLSKFTEQNYDMLRQFHSSDTLDHYIKVGV